MPMKLNSHLLEAPIEINGCTQVVVEDVAAYAAIVLACHRYGEESDLKLFNNDCKSLKSSEVVTITDIFNYNINTSAILKQIHSEIEDQLNEKPAVKTEIEQLTNQITELINVEVLNHELDLELDEITIQEVLIALGVKIEVDTDTLFEKVLEIFQVFKYLRNKKLLILVNTASYFTTEELNEMAQFVSLLQMNVLMIEPKLTDANITQYILDSDFFLTIKHGKMK